MAAQLPHSLLQNLENSKIVRIFASDITNDLYIGFKRVNNYYDKINELAERIVSGRVQIGRENLPGWREALTTAQVGAEIISAERGGISAAVSICSVEDRSIRRPIENAVEDWAKSSGLWLLEEATPMYK